MYSHVTRILGSMQNAAEGVMVKKGFQIALAAALAAAVVAPSCAWAQNTITTVAGGGPNRLPTASASIGSPMGVASFQGLSFIADPSSNRVLVVDGNGVSVFAGNMVSGYSGDGGPATSAAMNSPHGLAVDSSGNVFVADTGNNVIRKVDLNHNIQTIAGNGSACPLPAPGTPAFPCGDGGLATSAQLNSPGGVYVDGSGNVFIADTRDHRIRMVAAATGRISTVAGTGAQGYTNDGFPAVFADLNSPTGVSVDGSGNIFLADTGNNVIREVVAATGNIQTFAGNGSAGAAFNAPAGVFQFSGCGASGCVEDIFIADTGDNVIGNVNIASGKIETVAGNGGAGYQGDGGPATNAELNSPTAVFASGSHIPPLNVLSIGLLIADSKNNVVRSVVPGGGFLPAGTILTLAGNRTLYYSGDGRLGTDAELGYPWGAATDNKGNIFIADTGNNVIREIVKATGNIQTVAGTGTSGFAGDGGLASKAELNQPFGVFVDAIGDIFIADSGNNVIREVVATTGVIQTVAGNATAGYGGDGGLATSAELDKPLGIFVDYFGNMFIADTGNAIIREVEAATGKIETVAGIPQAAGYFGDDGPAIKAQLNLPTAVFLDGSGNIFIADANNNRVREVLAPTGVIQTVAGNGVAGFSGDGGPATNAELNFPAGVLVDGGGSIFVADYNNFVVRAVAGTTGMIHTVAGTHTFGFSGDGGSALSAMLALPSGLAYDLSGNLLLTDHGSSRVRQVAALATTGPGALFSQARINFSDALVSPSAVTQTVTLANSGSAPLTISGISIGGADASDFAETNTCNSTLNSQANCQIQVTFSPAAVGARTASLIISDNASGSPHTASLAGNGVDFSLAIESPLLPVTVTAGQQSVWDLEIQPSGFKGTVALSCTNAPPQGTCQVNKSIAVDGTNLALFAVTVSTTAPGSMGTTSGPMKTSQPLQLQALRPSARFFAALIFLAILLNVSRRLGSARLCIRALAGGFALLALFSGCGGSTSSPSPTGSSPVTLSTNSLTFANQTVGSTSSVQTVSVTNSGSATLSLNSIAITGNNSADFSSTTNCPSAVKTGATCMITVAFNPTGTGVRNAFLTISDNAVGSPQNVALAGTGIAASVGTPPGTYNLTVTATVGAVSRSTNLTLIVK